MEPAEAERSSAAPPAGIPAPGGPPAAPVRRRRLPWIAAGVGVAIAGVVLFWFQPQKLFIDDVVDEPLPSTPVAADGPAGPAVSGGAAGGAPAQPVEVARGEFVSLDHGTSGSVRVLELANGVRVVRLEALDTSNGPDLFVYLSANGADGDEGAFDDDYVDLGRLKGNKGDQNYEMPAGVDLRRYASVVIWCDRFDSAFGAADVVPV